MQSITLRIVLLIILFSSALAQTNELGCEEYTDHWLCPEKIIVINMPVEMTSNVECYELEGDDYGCDGQAITLSDVSFDECWTKYPLLPGNEIDYGKVIQQFDCQEKTWEKGSEFKIVSGADEWSECSLIDGNESYSIKECEAKGQALLVNASIRKESGENIVIAVNAVPKEKGMDWYLPLIIIAVILLILVFIYKKRR